MLYLSGVAHARIEHTAIGLLLNPASQYRTQTLAQYPYWAADNGCFRQGDRFQVVSWLRWLDTLMAYRHKHLFVVAPDVFHPSGFYQGTTIARATLDRSIPILPALRDRGFHAALVAQNGLEDEDIPWSQFDCLFIGGDTSWKLSPMAVQIVREAKGRGKWVHMGRVNSRRRMHIALHMGCDSVDGTYLKYGPDINRNRLIRWVQEVA